MSGLFSRPHEDAGAVAGGDPDAMASLMNRVGLDPAAPDGDATTDTPAKSFLGSTADTLAKAGQQQGDLADAQGRVAAAYAGAERAAAQSAASAGPIMPAAPAQGGPLQVMAGHAATGEVAAFAAMPGRR